MRKTKHCFKAYRQGALAFVLSLAVVFAAVTFADLDGVNGVAKANANNTLIVPKDFIQELDYNGDYDFGAVITQTYGTGSYAPRAKLVSKNHDGTVKPSSATSGDDGNLYSNPPDGLTYGLNTTWNIYYRFKNFPNEILNNNYLQMKINYTLSSMAMTDWFTVSMMFNDTCVEYKTEQQSGGAYFNNPTSNGTYDSDWKTVTKNACTLVFYHSSTSSPHEGSLKINSIQFRLNPAVAPGYDISNGSTEANVGKYKTYLPENTPDVAVPTQPAKTYNNASMTYEVFNAGNFKNAFAQSKKVEFTAESTDTIQGDSVTISKDGVSPIAVYDAKREGWLGSNGGKNIIIQNGNKTEFSFEFLQNGTYEIKARSISKRFFKITLVIDRIHTTPPNAATVTSDATAWNGNKNVTARIDCTPSASGVPYKFYYKLKSASNKYPDNFTLSIKDIETATPVPVTSAGDFTFAAESYGKYTICVATVDAAGNFKSGGCANFMVDSNLPVCRVETTYSGEWTNQAITFTLSNSAINYSPITYAYSTDGGVNWIEITGEEFTINSGTIDGDYKFTAKSEATGTYNTDAVAVKTKRVKFDNVAPAKPTEISFSPNDDPGKYYTDGWAISKDFTAGEDLYKVDSSLHYIISDEGGGSSTELTRHYDADGKVIAEPLNFDVGSAKKACRKTVEYWTVDQAGNASERVSAFVYVDANENYLINAVVDENVYFGQSGGSVDRGTEANGKRYQEKNITIKTAAGYEFYKLTDDREGEGFSTLYKGNPNLTETVDGINYTGKCGVSSVTVYFRKIIGVEPDNTVFGYNGAKQNVTLKAVGNVNPSWTIDFGKVKILYDGAESDGVRNYKEGGYAVTLDYTAYNTADENGDPNFVIETAADNITMTIAKASVIIVPDAKQKKVYDSANGTIAYTLTVNGETGKNALPGGDTLAVTLNTNAFAEHQNVGAYPITLGEATVTDGADNTVTTIPGGVTPLAESANYTFEFDGAKLYDVVPREIYFSYSGSKEKVYDGASTNVYGNNTAEAAFVDYFDAPEGGTSLKALYKFIVEVGYKWGNKNVGDNKKLTIETKVVEDAANYDTKNFSFKNTVQKSADGKITQKAVTVESIEIASKPYDGTANAELLNYNCTGIIPGDNVRIKISLGDLKFKVGENDVSDVGEYTFNISPESFRLDGNDSSNYSITVSSGAGAATASITPLPVRFKVPTYTKVYDRTTEFTGNDFTVIIETQLPSGQQLRVVYDRDGENKPALGTADADVITTISLKNLRLEAVDAATNAANYKLYGSDGSGVIAEYLASARISKALIKTKIKNQTVVYGDAFTYDEPEYTIDGKPVFKHTDGKWYCDFDEDQLTETDEIIAGFCPVFPVAKADGKLVGRKTQVGKYYIVNSGDGYADNYAFTVTNGELTVSPAELAFTVGNVERVSGATTDFVVEWSGFKNGDTVSAVKRIPELITTAKLDSPIGVYPVMIGDAGEAHNYTIKLPEPVEIADGTPVYAYVTVVKAYVGGTTFEKLVSEQKEIGGEIVKVYQKTVDYIGAPQAMYCKQDLGEYGYGYAFFDEDGNAVACETFGYPEESLFDQPTDYSSLPKAPKNVGKYTLVLKVCKLTNGVKNDSWEDEILHGELAIKKIMPMLNLKDKEAVYSNSPISVDAAVTSENIPVVYTYKSADGTTLAGPPADVGDYTVEASLVTTSTDPAVNIAIGNYHGKSVTVKLKITKAKIYVRVPVTTYVEGNIPDEFVFASANNDLLTGLVFENGKPSVAGTYPYTISVKPEYARNYEVVFGEGFITIGRNNIKTENGGEVNSFGGTIIASDTTIKIVNIPEDKKAADGSANKALWTQANGLTTGNDMVKGMFSVSMLTAENVEVQPTGMIKVVVPEFDGLSYDESDRLYLMVNGELSEVNAVVENGKLVFVTDETGDFVVIEDATAYKNGIFALCALAGLALTGLAMLIAVNKYRMYKLLRAAVKQAG